jgi:hypothetical protein
MQEDLSVWPLPQVKLAGGEELDYGVCLWSCGNAARPLVRQLSQSIAGQEPWRGNEASAKLAVDPFLRVVGASDTIAIGVGHPLLAWERCEVQIPCGCS